MSAKQFIIIVLLIGSLSINVIISAQSQLFLPGNTSTELCGNQINNLFLDENGDLYVATNYGISVKKTTKWDNYTITNGAIDINTTAVLKDSKNNIWIGTKDGVSKLYNDYVTVYSSKLSVYQYGSTADERTTIDHYSSYSTDPNYTQDIPDTVFTQLSGINIPQPLFLSSTDITCIFEDSQGKIWFGTINGGISCLNGNQWSIFNYNSNIPIYTCNAITETADGILWFATSDGVYSYDGYEFQGYLEKQNFYDITCDNENNIWCGSVDFLYKYDGNNWDSFDVPRANVSTKRVVLSICSDWEGKIWCTTNNGLLIFDSFGKPQIVNPGLDLENLEYTNIRINQGTVWIGTNQGIIKHKNNNWGLIVRKDGLASKIINRIDIDGNNSFWLATSQGFNYKSQTESWDLYNSQNTLLPAENINDIDYNGKDIWLATDSGVVKYNNGYSSIYQMDTSYSNDPDWIADEPEYFIPAFSWREKRWCRLLDNKANRISSNGKNIWIATEKGVSSFRDNNWKSFDYDPIDGLFDCPVHQIKENNSGIPYFASNCGVCVNSNNTWHKILYSETYLDSVVLLDNVQAMAFTPDNNLCISTDTRVKYNDINFNASTLYYPFNNYNKVVYGKLPIEPLPDYPFKPYEIKSNFDGIESIFFNEASPLCIDENNTYYIGNCILKDGYSYCLSDNKIITLDTIPPSIKPITYFSKYQIITKYFLSAINDIKVDGNNIWYATNTGLVKLEFIDNKQSKAIENTATSSVELDKITLSVNGSLVSVNNIPHNSHLTVYNVSGKCLFIGKASDYWQKTFATGVYILKINSDNNYRTYKFVTMK